MYSDIDKISLESTHDITSLWGPSSHHLNNWFHLDQERREKPYFIAIHEKGERIVPSLTPKNAMVVFHLLRDRFIEMSKNHPKI